MGEILRIHLPIGHSADFYADMTLVGNEVGYDNPDSFPWDALGIGAPHLDHALIVGDDMETTERLYMDVLDFWPTERMLATRDDGAPLVLLRPIRQPQRNFRWRLLRLPRPPCGHLDDGSARQGPRLLQA